MVPWAAPRSRFTLLFECLAIDVLSQCDVTGATKILRISWDEAWGILERAVKRGRQRKAPKVVRQIGVDEKAANGRLISRSGIVFKNFFAGSRRLDSSSISCYAFLQEAGGCMKTDLTGLDLHERLKKWADVTALSLRLMEASLQIKFPALSSEELRLKVIEQLHVFRFAKLPAA